MSPAENVERDMHCTVGFARSHGPGGIGHMTVWMTRALSSTWVVFFFFYDRHTLTYKEHKYITKIIDNTILIYNM